ncbi:hypothetical protein [Paraburkholderia bannensis]|uniref:hypothetical protein n=1 Tax=Paraburkholderia bannensis TaxID=765414 RepID=UPI002AC36463|nr:hypothetical protein [Paraburkholderia bannensis]
MPGLILIAAICIGAYMLSKYGGKYGRIATKIVGAVPLIGLAAIGIFFFTSMVNGAAEGSILSGLALMGTIGAAGVALLIGGAVYLAVRLARRAA